MSTIGDIISITKGKKHNISDVHLKISIRVLTIEDLRNDNNLKFTGDTKGTEVTKSDVLIAWDGANAGTIGYGKNGYIGSTIARLRIEKAEDYYAPFIGKFLTGKFRYLRKTATGATIPHINRKALERIKVPEIIYDDQVRIAGILSRAERLIKKRKESIRLLDEFLKSTFLEMFGDPVRNEKGWEGIALNNVGIFISGGTPSKKREDYWIGDFPWVSPKDMKVQYISNTQDHISENVFNETTLKRIDLSSILIVVRGMILAHTFPVAINIKPVSINQDMKAIRPSKYYLPIFLLYTLKNLDRKILSLVTSAGHGTKRLDSHSMENINVPKPPLSLQNQFASIVDKIEGIKAKYQVSLEELERLYGSLSQRVFKGELDLSRVKLK